MESWEKILSLYQAILFEMKELSSTPMENGVLLLIDLGWKSGPPGINLLL